MGISGPELVQKRPEGLDLARPCQRSFLPGTSRAGLERAVNGKHISDIRFPVLACEIGGGFCLPAVYHTQRSMRKSLHRDFAESRSLIGESEIYVTEIGQLVKPGWSLDPVNKHLYLPDCDQSYMLFRLPKSRGQISPGATCEVLSSSCEMITARLSTMQFIINESGSSKLIM